MAAPMVFKTSDNRELIDPQFIRIYEDKAIIVHEGGVESLEPTPEVIDFFKIPSAESSFYQPKVDNSKVSSWLVELKADEQSKKTAKRTGKPAKVAVVKADNIIKETLKETLKSNYKASVLGEKYDPEIFDGNGMSVTGTVTKITQGGSDTEYKIYLDDVAIFTLNSGEKVKSRDSLGNPKQVGNYTVGMETTIRGVCQGTNSNNYIIFSQ